MKIALFMIMCSAVGNTCLEPHKFGVYNNHYECMIAGYEESIKKAKEIGPKDINEYGTIIKFFCQRTDQEEKLIIPKSKPKTNI